MRALIVATVAALVAVIALQPHPLTTYPVVIQGQECRTTMPSDGVATVMCPDWSQPLKACEQEDSRNCYWNAAVFGNGVGDSFIDINGHAYYPAVTR